MDKGTGHIFAVCALVLLDRGTGSLSAGLGLKGSNSPRGVTAPNICSGADVNEWVSIVLFIYVYILPISNWLLAPQPMRKICPLWPPRQAINQTSRRFSGYFLFLSGTREKPVFVGADRPFPSEAKGNSFQCCYNSSSIASIVRVINLNHTSINSAVAHFETFFFSSASKPIWI